MLIDVSHYQGAIDWTRADPVIDGAYVKVTEGVAAVDARWSANHAGAAAGGRPVGGYHFADGADPVAEANHFADEYLAAAWQLDPVLDAEVPAVTAAWVAAFRTQLRARLAAAGRPTRFRLYTSYAYLTGQLTPSGWIDPGSTIWAARYAAALDWSHPRLVLWQNTSAAAVPGVLGDVDADQYMNGWTPAADQGAPVTAPTAQDIANAILDTPITRQGTGEAGTTSFRTILAWTDYAWALGRAETDAQAQAVLAAFKTLSTPTVDTAGLAAALAPLLTVAEGAALIAALKAQFSLT